MRNYVHIDVKKGTESITNIASQQNSVEIRFKVEKIYNPKVIVKKDGVENNIASEYQNDEVFATIPEQYYSQAGMFHVYVSHFDGSTNEITFTIEEFYKDREIRVKKAADIYKIICLEETKEGTKIEAGTALELTEDSTMNVLYGNGLYVDNNNQLCAVSTTIDINENNYLFGDMLTRQYPQGLECINGLFWTKKLEKCLLKFPYYVVLKGKTSPYFNIVLGGNVVINTWENNLYYNNDANFSFYSGIENVILDSGSFNSGQWYLENSDLDSYDYIYTNIENRLGLGPIALSKVEKTDILSGVEWENGGLSIGGTGLPLDTEELLSKRRRTKDFITIIPNHFYLLDNLTLHYFNAPHTEYEVNILYYLNGQYLTLHTFSQYCGTTGTTCIPQTFYSHPNANQIKLVLRNHDDTLEIPEDVLGNDLFSIYDCLLGGGEEEVEAND